MKKININNISESDKIKIISLYTGDKQSCEQISKLFPISSYTIRKLLINNNISRRACGSFFTEKERAKMLELYKTGLSGDKVAAIMNCSQGLVCQLARKAGIERSNNDYKDYPLNEDYFNLIDTPEKATILGFLYADGYVHEKYGSIRLQLQYRDEHILDQIQKEVQTNRPYNYRILKDRKYSGLTLHSGPMTKRLVALGCMQNKSFKIRFPSILNQEYIKYFIYGYWLGDGWSNFTLKGNVFNGRIGFASNTNFCKDLQTVFKQYFDINSNVFVEKDNPLTASLSIQSMKEILKFIKLMDMENNSIKIHRKVAKIKDLELCLLKKLAPINPSLTV